MKNSRFHFSALRSLFVFFVATFFLLSHVWVAAPVFADLGLPQTSSGTCENCVCSGGSTQGGDSVQGPMASVDACNQFCLKNKVTFKSCTTPKDTSKTAKNSPSLPTTCHCWCATSAGAKDVGTMAISACPAACQKTEDKKMVACSYGTSDTPDANQFCFSPANCKKADKDKNGKTAPGVFAPQAHDCPAGLSYCYPNPANGQSLKLQVPFDPANPTVIDLSAYINQAYTWMIGAGMTIAVVMMMIGGLQYVLAAGGGSVEKGKKRIMNGIIGFVLLLFVNLILQTVNPYLLKLQVPSLPLIKQIGIPNGASCEEFIAKVDEKGNRLYALTPTPKGGLVDGKYKGDEGCGDKAELSAAGGAPGVASGSTCEYMDCGEPLKKCVSKHCLSCLDVFDGNEEGVKPSSAICGLLTPTIDSTTNSVAAQCSFVTNQSLLTIGLSSFVQAATGASIDLSTKGSCVLAATACASVHSCSDYINTVTKIGSGKAGTFKDLNATGLEIFGYPSLCASNICKINGGCKYSDGACVAQ